MTFIQAPIGPGNRVHENVSSGPVSTPAWCRRAAPLAGTRSAAGPSAVSSRLPALLLLPHLARPASSPSPQRQPRRGSPGLPHLVLREVPPNMSCRSSSNTCCVPSSAVTLYNSVTVTRLHAPSGPHAALQSGLFSASFLSELPSLPPLHVRARSLTAVSMRCATARLVCTALENVTAVLGACLLSKRRSD